MDMADAADPLSDLRDHIDRRFDQVDAELRDVKRIVGTTKVETSALIDEVANINRKLLSQD